MFELLKTAAKQPEPSSPPAACCRWSSAASGVFLRQLPQHLWQWFIGQTTMTLTVKDDDAAFRWLKEWFLEQDFLKRVRWLDLDTTLRGAELALIPSPGRHRFFRGRRPFWVWFYRSEETKGVSQRRIESLTFRTIGRDTQVLRSFVKEIVACHHKKQRTTSCLYVYNDGWDEVQAYSLLASSNPSC